MPRFNASGTLAAFGVGDGPLWLLEVATEQGRLIRQPGGPCDWIDDNEIAFQTKRDDGTYGRAEYHVPSGQLDILPGPGANAVAGGGGKALWWTANVGVTGSLTDPNAGLSPGSTDSRGAVGRDGTMAVKPHYHGDAIDLIAPNGEVTATLPGVLGLQVLGPHLAIWNGGALGWTPQRISGEAWTRVAEVDGVLWLVSWLDGSGLVAHRSDDASRGYIVTRSDAFYHDAVGKDGRLLVAYSTNQGESFGSGVLVDVFSECEETDLEPEKFILVPSVPLGQIPELSGEYLVAWYQMRNTPESYGFPLPPGNAEVVVGHPPGYPAGIVRPLPLISMTGNYSALHFEVGGRTYPPFAVRIGSEGGDQDAVRFQKMIDLTWEWYRIGVRSVFYWDERRMPWLPDLPPDTLIEVISYCAKAETIQSFEADLRAVLSPLIGKFGSRRILLACQWFTTNPALRDDPSPTIPVCVRLIQELNLLGASAFNDTGRDIPEGVPGWGRGGLSATQNLRPYAQKAFGRCTFPASLIDTGEPPDPVDPPGDDMHISIYDYDKTFVRGGPDAHLGVDNAFEVEPDPGRRILEIEVGAEGGGRRIKVRFPDENGQECRGIRFKPTEDGEHKFLVRAWDNVGQEAFAYGDERILVTSVDNGGGGTDPDPDPGDTTFPFPALLRQFAARYPAPQTPGGGDAHEEACRQWTIKFAEQVAFEHGQSYGCKRAAPGRPISKDSLARQVSRTVLWSWDLLVGTGTGFPVVADDPAWHDITGQVFESVLPVDHL